MSAKGRRAEPAGKALPRSWRALLQAVARIWCCWVARHCRHTYGTYIVCIRDREMAVEVRAGARAHAPARVRSEAVVLAVAADGRLVCPACTQRATYVNHRGSFAQAAAVGLAQSALVPYYVLLIQARNRHLRLTAHRDTRGSVLGLHRWQTRPGTSAPARTREPHSHTSRAHALFLFCGLCFLSMPCHWPSEYSGSRWQANYRVHVIDCGTDPDVSD